MAPSVPRGSEGGGRGSLPLDRARHACPHRATLSVVFIIISAAPPPQVPLPNLEAANQPHRGVPAPRTSLGPWDGGSDHGPELWAQSAAESRGCSGNERGLGGTNWPSARGFLEEGQLRDGGYHGGGNETWRWGRGQEGAGRQAGRFSSVPRHCPRRPCEASGKLNSGGAGT